jgi:hypothetical protein
MAMVEFLFNLQVFEMVLNEVLLTRFTGHVSALYTAGLILRPMLLARTTHNNTRRPGNTSC